MYDSPTVVFKKLGQRNDSRSCENVDCFAVAIQRCSDFYLILGNIKMDMPLWCNSGRKQSSLLSSLAPAKKTPKGSFYGANAQNWSRITKYICSPDGSKSTKCSRPRLTCRKATWFRLSILDESKAVCFLHWLIKNKTPAGVKFLYEPMPRIELGTYALPWRCSTI